MKSLGILEEIKDLNMMEPNLPLSDKEIENGTKVIQGHMRLRQNGILK